MIYEEAGVFVISSQHVWRPGNYATKAAAQYALAFPEEALATIEATINRQQQRPITTEDLKAARR